MITDMINIDVQKTANSRVDELDYNNIKFGKQFSDHMFVVDYVDGKWTDPKIMPFGKMELSPATSALHYGQALFEGMKAHKDKDGNVFIFRPEENMKRLNISAERLCMPAMPQELFEAGLYQLLEVDNKWIPDVEGTSLYIRPFMFATDDYIGVKPSDNYRFIIFSSPVGGYYSEPVNVKIETYYTRAANGGVGFAKAAGNYAASLYPAKLGQEKGYHQLIWTDSKEHKYIEEAGTMNICFVIDGKLISPMPGETVLRGITRESILDIARDWGVEVEERKVTVEEVITAAKEGKLQDAFGAGTAATVAHINIINHEGIDYQLPPVEARELSNKLKRYLLEYKTGAVEDKFGWRKELQLPIE